MSGRGRKYVEAKKKVDQTKRYDLDEGIKLLKETAPAKFDECVDMAIRLGVNPKHSDQMVRGTVVLPHGVGRSVKVLVFAKGEKEKEAKEAREFQDLNHCLIENQHSKLRKKQSLQKARVQKEQAIS